MNSILKIKKDKNEVVQEILSIFKGSGTTVDYSTTVFGSNYTEYKLNVENNVGSILYESTKNKLWDTFLIVEPSTNEMFYKSEKNKGVNFGWIMLDYIGQKPLLCCVVEFDGGTYTYKSATFDKETKSFVNSQNESITTTKSRELAEFMVEKFNLDLDKYKLQPKTKKQD
jgi:hypothetical protein